MILGADERRQVRSARLCLIVANSIVVRDVVLGVGKEELQLPFVVFNGLLLGGRSVRGHVLGESVDL